MYQTILSAFHDELEKIASSLPFTRSPWAPSKGEVGIMQQHGPVRRRKLIPDTTGLHPTTATARVRNMTRAVKVSKAPAGLLRPTVSMGLRTLTKGRLG
jgi:hypothetical protein